MATNGDKTRPPAGSATADNHDALAGRAAAPNLLPSLSLPKGGGALSGIGEKFTTNPATGTASLTVPIATSPGRLGFNVALQLAYDSGSGNGPFGIGWQLGVGSITRKTDKGLPRYADVVPDDGQRDVFTLTGAEDLVPLRLPDGDGTRPDVIQRDGFTVQRYRPRVEGGFARIERWTASSSGDTHWRVVTGDNVSNVFGLTPAARVTDPDDPRRVFSWLLEEVRDDRGNVAVYQYKPEDGAGVDFGALHEAGRRASPPTAQRYLKRVRYGNRTPVAAGDPAPSDPGAWLFEAVLDYGEHADGAPTPDEDQAWTARPDAFSTYRPGFDVRTYRLCRRVLMFHRFAELGAAPTLVRATRLSHDPGPVTTYLTGITHAGYQRDAAGSGYLPPDELPTVVLDYSRPAVHQSVKTLDPTSLDGIPEGVESGKTQWVDLDGEGLPGVLTATDQAWFYKRNLGGGRLAPPTVERQLPVPADPSSGLQQLVDLAGDGQLDLVQYSPRPLAGFFERTSDGGWEPFLAFSQLPNLDWTSPQLRFVDVDGDGLPDLLVTEDQAFVWHRFHGKDGFDAGVRIPRSLEESRGPTVLFMAAGLEAIELADMSGDGLLDIVRIRNGEVCYWPNLGYGRFGTKITMDRSPIFAAADEFDPRRVRLGDIDGSGTTDFAYCGRDGVTLYFNQSGNGFSAPTRLDAVPVPDLLTSVSLLDVLGQGTAALVFSTPWPGQEVHPLSYVDLMGGEKPHLLNSIRNGLGGEARVGYAPSTRFYLADRAAGRPWLTRLPFPVQVVERIENVDRVANTHLVTTYSYRHGFFDGFEREFRGFAYVEQLDAESFGGTRGIGLFPDFPDPTDPQLRVPPVRTRTWIHTGAWLEKERLELALSREYYAQDLAATLLPDTPLPPALTPREQREATRALRGRILHREVYSDDGTDRAPHPYLVSERSYDLRVVQRVDGRAFGSFFVSAAETIDRHYERNPADPRVTHELILAVDEFGAVTQAAALAYPRRQPDEAEQGRLWASLSDHTVTNVPDQPDFYRLGVPIETVTSELTGLGSAGPLGVFTRAEVAAAIGAAREIAFEVTPAGNDPQRRVVDRVRTLYYDESLSDVPLPLRQINRRALPFQTRQAAFTPGLLSAVYDGRIDATTLSTVLTAEGRYLLEDGVWWTQSGRLVFDPTRFYLPIRAIDPFTQVTTVDYDVYALFVTRSEDAVGNVVIATHSYRVLQPEQMTDPNRNRTAVAFDTLGRVERVAVMGKEGAGEGDTLDDPTRRFEYDVLRFQHQQRPVFAHVFAREKHGPANPRFQEAFTYSDGSGREVMMKVQAEPGPAPARDADGVLLRDAQGKLIFTPTTDRWVGSGRTVFDNKGNPVKQYEPFFSSTPEYEDEADLVQSGVTPILHYDPLGRLTRTELPDGSLTRGVFDAWTLESWNQNDTLNDDGGTLWLTTRLAKPVGDPDRRAAELSQPHAGTPAVSRLDALGRVFLQAADNGPRGQYRTHTDFDIEGNALQVTDPRGVKVATQTFDLLGRVVLSDSADGGARAILPDVTGKPLRVFDARGRTIRHVYDVVQRAMQVFVAEAGAAERLVELTVFGERHPEAQARNLRGQPFQIYDGSGVLESSRFDFKANLLESSRHLAADYHQTADWGVLAPLASVAEIAAAALPFLAADTADESFSFSNASTFDALNRVISQTAPDGSVIVPVYNAANLLESLQLRVGGAAAVTTCISNLDYNARAQRERFDRTDPAALNQGTVTTYQYDPLTFRLVNLHTTRVQDGAVLQDLSYTYDAVGNVMALRDGANPNLFFARAPVSGDGLYQYDALNWLVSAEGREHPGQQPTADDPERGDAIPHPNDLQALRRYVETYEHDPSGNIMRLTHQANGDRWVRRYNYGGTSNQLLFTSAPGQNETDPPSDPYTYDPHGNMLSMPHLTELRWDHEDRLTFVDKGGGGQVFFTYDAIGQRVRKVWEHDGLVEERAYLGGWEVFRRRRSGGLELARETLHVMDDQRTLALLETTVVDTAGGATGPVFRYQLENQLGSSLIEVTAAARIISYEEYYVYGATSFHIRDATIEVSDKRYRFSGKERDEETGLSYYGARYYATWLGRWTSPDPAGLADGTNRYRFARNNPMSLIDPTGTISWGQVLGIAAAVVVGTVLTVATGGLLGPVVGPITAGIIGGVVGGAAGGVASEITEALVDKKPIEAKKVLTSALVGAAFGGVLSGIGAGLAKAAGSKAGQALIEKFAASATGQALGRVATNIGRSFVGRAARAVGTALKENVERPAQQAGEGLAKKLGGKFAERGAAAQGERELGEQVLGDVAHEVENKAGESVKRTEGAIRGNVDEKEVAAVTRSGEAGSTSGRGAIREPRTSTPESPGQVIAPAVKPEAQQFKAYDIGHPRENDAEKKLIEHALQGATPSSTGNLAVGASKTMCFSCVGVCCQARVKFPGINILRISPSIEPPAAGIGGAVAPSVVRPGDNQVAPTVPLLQINF